MWKEYNPSPKGKRVGDCVIRAISKALDQSWDETYVGIVLKGYELCDMPSANYIWGEYLKDHGFRRHLVPDVGGRTRSLTLQGIIRQAHVSSRFLATLCALNRVIGSTRGIAQMKYRSITGNTLTKPPGDKSTGIEINQLARRKVN